MIELSAAQIDAINRMRNGCILNGGVGSGKTRTSLAYYYKEHGGSLGGKYIQMVAPRDLYIITTAKKRDDLDWEEEMLPFLINTNPEVSIYSHKVVVDSWNNIQKYANVYGAFFIFDEQRLVGKGAWVKAFYKIAKKNRWILLTATPGDTWSDYIPVFVANGFYKNKTELLNRHAVYSRFTNFPKIDRWTDEGRLLKCKRYLLIDLESTRHTKPQHHDIFIPHDAMKYREIIKTRWNPYKDKPFKTAAELCYTLRRVINSSEDRQIETLKVFEQHQKLIVFYNFDYELEILKNLGWGDSVKVSQWNGHKHEPVPTTDSWVYLVQYTAGAEGWNCITTNAILFYSQNYSYKVMAQSAGRIDRMNTPFVDLYYYHLKTRSPIDIAISRALKSKKRFNETKFANGL